MLPYRVRMTPVYDDGEQGISYIVAEFLFRADAVSFFEARYPETKYAPVAILSLSGPDIELRKEI